jgi:hypothetical protein
MSDDPVTRILSAVERLRAEVLARIDRLESALRGNSDLLPTGAVALLPARIIAHVQNVGDLEGNLGDWLGERRSGRWIEGFGLKDLESLPRRTLLQKSSYIGLFSDARSYRRGRCLAGSAAAKG